MVNERRVYAQKDGEDPFSSQKAGEGSGAHKRTMYELFVLGELLDGPHHGYQLREILSRLLGPFRQISWGILYPLIRQLEREGLLTSESEGTTTGREKAGASGRVRKPYAITSSGRQRFYALMEEQGEYHAEYRELFIIKLNNFDYLSAQQQLNILWQYRSFLQAEDLYLSGGQQRVLTNPHLLDEHRTHILRIIRFRQSSIQGEMPWIEEQIQRLEAETEENF
jgi:DNA-binding PadR family transcriptional regulator